MLYGKLPDLSYISTIGSKAYVRIPNIPKLLKMNPRAQIGYLVGYESLNSFWIWILQKRRIITTRDVIFDENSRYNSIEKQELSPQIIELLDNQPLD